jgi:myo-inositol 2-dehydrogenase/D-chiro-inositol 1-dehydrogenase
MPPVRLALIGAGRMGSTHARALADRPDGVELVAVVEPSDDAARRSGIAARYGGLDELLAAGGVDGAIVAAPTRLHALLVTQLLEAGLPVLCEKPCGRRSDETRALARRAVEARVPVHIGYWRRFVPALRELQAELAAGSFGALELVACAQWDESPPPAAFRDPASSGGIVVDMGVHELDQLRWLTGREPELFAGLASRAEVDGDPDGVAFALRLGGGGLATVSLLRRHPPGDLCRVEVVGSRKVTRLDFLAPAAGEQAFLAALRAQAADFAAAIAGHPSRGASPADAVRALELAEQTVAALAPQPSTTA